MILDDRGGLPADSTVLGEEVAEPAPEEVAEERPEPQDQQVEQALVLVRTSLGKFSSTKM